MSTVPGENEPTQGRKPWYREPWPWILMSGPGLVVVAAIATAVIAFRSADGLVADDYYKQGLGVNRQIARDERARELGIRGTLALEGGKIRVVLQSSQPLPGRLTLRLAHHAKASEDRIVHLAVQPDGAYEAPLEPLGTGRWRAIAETAEWRIAAQIDPKAGHTADMTPGVR